MPKFECRTPPARARQGGEKGVARKTEAIARDHDDTAPTAELSRRCDEGPSQLPEVTSRSAQLGERDAQGGTRRVEATAPEPRGTHGAGKDA